MARSARGCVRFVEVWSWGGISSGNFSVVSLNIFVNFSSACVCRTGWFFYWYFNILTSSMRYFANLVDAPLGVSMGTQMCCWYSFYWPETRIPPVVGNWNFRHLQWSQVGPMYHASNAMAPHELLISGGLKIVALVAGGSHGCLLKL